MSSSGLVSEDTLRHAYFEGDVAGLRAAFAQSVRQGEIIAETIKPGVLGHEIKAIGEERGLAEGITNSTYPHAQGNWVHGSGSWGSPDWPERYGTSVRLPIRENQVFAVEPIVHAPEPRSGEPIHIALENDVVVTTDGCRLLGEDQQIIWLI